MIKPDIIWLSLINCNNQYQQITQERKPTIKERKLKNVTPQKKKLSLSFKEVSNGS